ncbi:MAG: DUF58 domain-containing protein [Acidimicrobiia bacterium]|nr:DUF58 domain-containing protein [Acidimicrobiia bacterium]
MANTRVRIRPTRGVYTIGALSLAFLVASRTTGAGWLTVLLAIALSLLVMGLVGPWFAIRRLVVTVNTPDDAVAGRPFDVHLTVDGRPQSGRLRLLEPASDWVGATMPATGTVRAIAQKRGVITQVVGELATAAPIGLVWATRQVTVTIDPPIAVAPRVESVAFATLSSSPATGSEAVGRRTGAGETVRSIRDYQQGDSLRMIHWPATARLNRPVVKELESPDAPHLVVRLDLNCPPDEADHRASLAYGHIQRGLAAGVPVRLLTAEKSGPHAGSVGSMLEAGRRLAYASSGVPANPLDDDHAATVVHVP